MFTDSFDVWEVEDLGDVWLSMVVLVGVSLPFRLFFSYSRMRHLGNGRAHILILELCHLLELCLRSIYFQFGRPFFEQVQGAAMGSPLLPIMTNIFMEDPEMPALETSPCRWDGFTRLAIAEEGKNSPHLCLPQEDAHKQITQLQLASPCQGVQRRHTGM